ncbi:IclR family transcriptional regulator [Paenarthrobacter ureafaciens]|uniref:IclR family transcriptional regulator n=1 Tax=Paenarthrobacter ureafaciens TaxID=37931 RepID=UPI002DB80283|nr:helix-turn-helix domain-containing protein [Paenarthrobacter ureafaciens]MEC3853655.1 helix-turn-helix domain-containing protein [Paenarthrobacter ureafaciens]
MSTLQTLDRGIRALEVVAARSSGISVADLSAEIGVARAIGYRLVSTLEEHRLLTRDVDGKVYLGASIPALASQYWPGLLSLATPVLQDLADKTNATAFMSVAEGDEAVAVLSLDPAAASVLRVGYRVGSRHPLTLAAAGIAILAARAPSEADLPEVVEARRQGYVITRGQLQAGAVGVAAPLRLSGTVRGGPEASIGVVALQDFDSESASDPVLEAARKISATQ